MSVFYQKNLTEGKNTLSEEESKHCALVLRHKEGDEIKVFDGIGGKHDAVLTYVSKKSCEFEIIRSVKTSLKKFSIHLGIAPTKNADRMEWMVEKLSELGVDEITLLETAHSERRKLRLDRLEKKAISAMKQSGNPFLLKINPLVGLDNFIMTSNADIKLITHVDDKNDYFSDLIKPNKSIAILVGPEGDFSGEEIRIAQMHGFKTASLGQNVLRTETAGISVCCMVNVVNKY